MPQYGFQECYVGQPGLQTLWRFRSSKPHWNYLWWWAWPMVSIDDWKHLFGSDCGFWIIWKTPYNKRCFDPGSSCATSAVQLYMYTQLYNTLAGTTVLRSSFKNLHHFIKHTWSGDRVWDHEWKVNEWVGIFERKIEVYKLPHVISGCKKSRWKLIHLGGIWVSSHTTIYLNQFCWNQSDGDIKKNLDFSSIFYWFLDFLDNVALVLKLMIFEDVMILDQVSKILIIGFYMGETTIELIILKWDKEKQLRELLILENQWREGFESMSKR